MDEMWNLVDRRLSTHPDAAPVRPVQVSLAVASGDRLEPGANSCGALA